MGCINVDILVVMYYTFASVTIDGNWAKCTWDLSIISYKFMWIYNYLNKISVKQKADSRSKSEYGKNIRNQLIVAELPFIFLMGGTSVVSEGQEIHFYSSCVTNLTQTLSQFKAVTAE